ncbi:MAG: hypothetical protein JRN59_05370 [Nitrososphaerota archaeon]|nr:hypothetical protein [Nitrososphaerota archaeon]
MRLLPILLVPIILSTSMYLVGVPHQAPQDPCDSYGDCVSSSISYIRANPDHTLYLGDSFQISVSITTGPNTTSHSLSWSYDQSEFRRTGDSFNVSGSAIGVYSVTASATFVGSVTVGNSTELFNSTLSTSQEVAVVRYDPQFTAYAYMLYGNSTASSSLQRPWVLLVRYDGNLPGYSFAGDGNTAAFNGSRTLAERAYFDSFRFTTFSYQSSTIGGVLDFHAINSTGTAQYDWLNRGDSAPLYHGNRIEKYVFQATPSSLSSLLAQGFVYQNVTMVGCWQQEGACDLKQPYWLVPFLWSGRLNVVSVDSSGNPVPSTPISLTIQNPYPLDDWLTSNFQQVFGSDPAALRAFSEDLYSTNQSMTFTGTGVLSLVLNQTSLVPPQISLTAGSTISTGTFDFTPTLVDSAIMSVPNSLNGTVFYANATIPLWSYNMIQGNLAYLPIFTTIDHPTAFLELVNDGQSGWVAGNTTEPQTPSAFASQEYGFWPMGGNLTVYVNLQGGGVNLLGVQKISPSEYQASFYVEPWSGGISSVHVTQGSGAIENESTLDSAAYPSPLPQGLTGFFSITYPATGQDVRAVFANVWGAKTTVDLGVATAPAPLATLIPETTVAAFAIAGVVWLIASGVLKTRKPSIHQ